MSDYDSWAAIYDRWGQGMPNDVEHYIRLARDAEGPIVELAVGTGRVAIPIATETGKRVIGIDSSKEMLALARERVHRLPIELRVEDMRELTLAEPTDLIICPSRSLLHLPGWHDKRTVFERVVQNLRPGGRFAFNAFAFSHVVATQLDGQTIDRDGIVHTLTYAPADNRIDITRDGAATLRLWWATKSEWEGLIDVAGLEVEALYGGFEREPYADDSNEMVWITRKP